ncbi:MAG: DUF4271 domain-containing protein [Prolixibacteraceae bacterium]|nr:DUF4271 domain-containing protein [Prolixibacteraceae bacterium]
MISFSVLQMKGFLSEFNIAKDSLSVADSISASGSQYIYSSVDTINAVDSIITKVYPDTLTYTFGDTLFQKLIQPCFFEKIEEGYYNFNFIPKNQFVENWSIILIVLLFVLLVTMLLSSEKYISQLLQSVFNKVVANRLYREKVGSLLEVSNRLDLFFFLNAGLYLYHIANFYGDNDSSIVLYGICLGAIFGWVIIKFMAYRLTGFIFDTSSETREYIFYLKLGNRVTGLLLFPIAIALFFIKTDIALVFFIIGGILIVFNIFQGIYRGIQVIGQKVFSIYYLILYLCTLEILPLVFVWRILWRE